MTWLVLKQQVFQIKIKMKKEIHLIFTALMFYTRIPCPKWVDHNATYLNLSTKYLPFIGWIVGAISAVIFYFGRFLLPVEISIFLAILAGFLTTGGFHEDGLADVCDGFGGGWTQEKILAIMKDSRVGTYGVLGLIIAVGLKFLGLNTLLENANFIQILAVFIAAHSVSRLAATSIIYTEKYAREDASAKAKPVAKKMKTMHFVVAVLFGLSPLVLFFSSYILLVLIPVIILRYYLVGYFNKWVKGYTGDCLGATQQITEVIFYLSLIAYGNLSN